MESKLISKAKQGDNSAISEIIQLTERKAYFIAYKVVKNEETAKDIVQEAYIQAFQKLSQLTDETKFESWFNQIVSHKALDYTKSKYGKNKPVDFTSLEDEENRLEFEANIKNDKKLFEPEASVDYKELQEGVQEVLDGLPENQRLALMMYYFDDMSVSEMSDVFGVSNNTVKGYLAYGRKKIKTVIEGMRAKGVSFYGIAPIPFLTWMLHEQAAKTVVKHVSKDIIIKSVGGAAAASTAGAASAKASASKSGIGKWWASKTASAKAGICAGTVAVTGAAGYYAYDYNSNYNQVVRAVEKLDTLDSFHVKVTDSFQNSSYTYDVYIKNTDDEDEYYSIYTDSVPENAGYTYVYHFNRDKCQMYYTQDPVSLDSIDNEKFEEYTKIEIKDDGIYNYYDTEGKSFYKQTIAYMSDSYTTAYLKTFGKFYYDDEDSEIKISQELIDYDKKQMNASSFTKLEDVKRLEFSSAIWTRTKSNEIKISDKLFGKNSIKIRNGYIISSSLVIPPGVEQNDTSDNEILTYEFDDFKE